MSFLADTNTLIYASKNRAGEIAKWLKLNRPRVTDVNLRECLTDWPHSELEEKQNERLFLKRYFDDAGYSGRLVRVASYPELLRRGLELRWNHGVKFDDALVAATAEYFDLTLVTADTRRNFAPRLEQLNAAGLGTFKLRTYRYEDREATFAKWNAETSE